MTTVVLTGASGLCGRAIARRLYKMQGVELVTTSRRWLPGRHVVHDLHQPLRLGSGGFPERADLIIHAASEVDERSTNDAIFERNVRAATHAADYARAAGAVQIVHLSSVSVYGQATGSARLDERSQLRPSTPYARSKLASEQLLRERSGAPVAQLRLAYVLGPGMAESTIVRRFERAIRAGEAVLLINPDTSRLHFVGVEDVAEACALTVGLRINAVANLAGPERPTVRQLFEKVCHHLGTRVDVEEREEVSSVMDVDFGGGGIHGFLPDFRYRPFDNACRDALGG